MIELVLSTQRSIEPASMEDYESIKRLKPGSAMTAHVWAPRNLAQHRWWRAFLQFIAENWPDSERQPTADDVNSMLKRRVGFGEWVIDLGGEATFREKSTAFGVCPQDEFDKYIRKAEPIAWEHYLPSVDRMAVNAHLQREASWNGSSRLRA
jgi:hypothetical protein